jgi:hypothetical protein
MHLILFYILNNIIKQKKRKTKFDKKNKYKMSSNESLPSGWEKHVSKSTG